MEKDTESFHAAAIHSAINESLRLFYLGDGKLLQH